MCRTYWFILLLVAMATAVSSPAFGDHGRPHSGHQPEPCKNPAELPGDRFHVVLPPEPKSLSSRLSEFTFAGPVDGSHVSLPPVPRGINKFAPSMPALGVAGVWVYELDLDGGEATKLQPQGVPAMDWIEGAAFDSVRNRVLVSTIDGQGYLYSVDPATGSFSVLQNLAGVDLYEIAYSPADDHLFAIGGPFGSTHLKLFEYSSSGELINEQPLDLALPGHVRGYWDQLAVVGDYLALVQFPGAGLLPVIQAIDPETAETWCVAVPEPTAWSLTLLGAVGLGYAQRGRRRPLSTGRAVGGALGL